MPPVNVPVQDIGKPEPTPSDLGEKVGADDIGEINEPKVPEKPIDIDNPEDFIDN